MALEDILAAISAEGERARAEIMKEAEAQRERILQQAEARAQEAIDHIRRLAEQRRQQERAQALYQARLEAARRRNEAWEAAFRETLDEVRKELSRARERPDYDALLRALLEEALAEVDTPPVIHVDPADEALARALVAELEGDARLETDIRTWGGVQIDTADGRIAVRNTLEARLERAEPFLRRLLASIWGTPAPSDGDSRHEGAHAG